MRLKYFVGGAFFAIAAVPALSEISEIISIASEWLKSSIGIKVVKNQKSIEGISESQNKSDIQAIGFKIEEQEDDIQNEY